MVFEREQAFIRQRVQANPTRRECDKVLWSRHAIGKLIEEGISRQEIEEALATCEVIEKYPARTGPLPDCLVLGWIRNQEPIHAVVAIDEANDCVFVITVYRPDRRRWEDGYRVRKR
jgi:hypothetical protein